MDNEKTIWSFGLWVYGIRYLNFFVLKIFFKSRFFFYQIEEISKHGFIMKVATKNSIFFENPFS